MLGVQLRLRFLASLAASGALVGTALAACGGATETLTPAGGSSGSSGSSGESSSGSSGSSGESSSGAPSDSPPPAQCRAGGATTTCYTHEQLDAKLRHPNVGPFPDAGTGGADAGVTDTSAYFDENGCLPPTMVVDGCCNAAVSGPTWDAASASCCYVHCKGSCCGRPFLVRGEARLADVRERDDWKLHGSAPTTSPLSPSAVLTAEQRERIATAWARDAAMEHASVASFARFTLELLALGAPADIVLAAQGAARDEVEHALACFAIASRYARRDLGPGKLDVRGATPMTELPGVVAAAVVEACIGETLSALLAEARLARAEDADVRAALRRIANEEAQHAELAWRFVGWAIATSGADLRVLVARAFEDELARMPQVFDASLRGIPRATLRAHGLLDESAASEVARHAMDDVLGPCIAALVGEGAIAA